MKNLIIFRIDNADIDDADCYKTMISNNIVKYALSEKRAELSRPPLWP